MKTIRLPILGSIVIVLAATGCLDDLTIKGNGIQATELRIAAPFKKVSSAGSFIIHITGGDNYEVLVSAEENIIPYIETYVRGDVLEIDFTGHTSVINQLPMEVFVTTPNLEGIRLSSSGMITTDYFIVEKMDILLSGSGIIAAACETKVAEAFISGSGRIELSGIAETGKFKISGSGLLDAADFVTTDCFALISGSGDMRVNVNDYLEARISGSGNIFYYGNPTVDTNISGSGNVIRQK